MSKTDKTNPYWVKLARMEWGAKPRHWHHGRWFTGVCEVVTPMPRSRRNGMEDVNGCEIWQSYYNDYGGNKIWGRFPKGDSRKDFGKDGRARMELRRLKHKWATVAREDIDSFEAAPYQRWLWAKWYWD